MSLNLTGGMKASANHGATYSGGRQFIAGVAFRG